MEYLDIPAFFRRQADADPEPALPSHRGSLMKRLTSVFSRAETSKASASTGTAATSFAQWLEIHALRLAERPQPLPTLAELDNSGLPDDLLAQLRQLVAQGDAEDVVVAALLYAFLQHGPKCALPRKFTRLIRAGFQRQVSAALAATVEARVKTWCATG